MNFTERESEYMDYIDGALNCEGHGLLLYKGDEVAWNVGLQEWQTETYGEIE